MKTVNEMKLCVPSKSCNEAFARCVVSAFVMSLDPTVNELSDLKTAVSEAVTNCIVHGYRHQSGKIYISFISVIHVYPEFRDISDKTPRMNLLPNFSECVPSACYRNKGCALHKDAWPASHHF